MQQPVFHATTTSRWKAPMNDDGDDLQPQHPSVQRYQINNLFEQIARMRDDIKEGFADMRLMLDSRLESRDKQLSEHEGRIRDLEGLGVRVLKADDHEDRLRKVESRTDRQLVVNAVLAAIGGGALALVVRLLVA